MVARTYIARLTDTWNSSAGRSDSIFWLLQVHAHTVCLNTLNIYIYGCQESHSSWFFLLDLKVFFYINLNYLIIKAGILMFYYINLWPYESNESYFVCVYVHVFLCDCVLICICMCVCTCMCVHVCTCVCVWFCIHVRLCVLVHLQMCMLTVTCIWRSENNCVESVLPYLCGCQGSSWGQLSTVSTVSSFVFYSITVLVMILVLLVINVVF